MAVQSLYRKYRPRRFDQLKGQDHVVRALRNAVINNREGQAYLFSGPRGTGKTSTARILAKVLNCDQTSEGEPCGTCDSCVAVDAGTSFDVLELDAASNSGVENMRDLIERAVLGNPGRHRVFILDEVHMLSNSAEAALLKTLEEPPDHVVFVLATTEPQKIGDTIRSRTQHLQFHLLPLEEMRAHVSWIVADAGLSLSSEAIERVIQVGAGSVRDTLSALELAVASGGEIDQQVAIDEFVEAFIDLDPSRALISAAQAIQFGTDPRTLTEEIVRYLRDMFLSLMAPQMVQLPKERSELVGNQARKMGASAIVRAIEQLGQVLIEIRHAPDARLLVEVALVKLTRHNIGADVASLLLRVEKLEAQGIRDSSGPLVRPAVIDPVTGRSKVGGRAVPMMVEDAPKIKPTNSAPIASVGSEVPDAEIGSRWPEIIGAQTSMTKALFGVMSFVGCVDGVVTLLAPNDVHAKKASEYLDSIRKTLQMVTKRNLRVDITFSERKTVQKRGINRDEIDEDPVDPDEIVKESDGKFGSAIDDLAKAFPGSKIVNDTKK